MLQCQVSGSLPDTGKAERKQSLSWHVKVETFTFNCLQCLVILIIFTSLLHLLQPLLLIHPPAKGSLPPSYAGKSVGKKKLSQKLLKNIPLLKKPSLHITKKEDFDEEAAEVSKDNKKTSAEKPVLK